MNNNQEIWVPKIENVMEDMMDLLKRHNIKDFRTIELFSADGSMICNKMAEKSITFVGYEIDPDKEEAFKKNVKNGEFRCADSIKMLANLKEGEIGTYNLISMDAPCCVYGEDYCEHFNTIRYVYKLIKQGEKVGCVFPVVIKPYDTDKPENRVWIEKRKEFYNTADKNLDPEQICDIYDSVFEEQNIQVIERCYTCRKYRNGEDWLYEYMYVLKK